MVTVLPASAVPVNVGAPGTMPWNGRLGSDGLPLVNPLGRLVFLRINRMSAAVSAKVSFPVAPERLPEQLPCLRLCHIVWVDEEHGVLTAELPEKALLRDGLRNPPHQPRLHTPEERRADVARRRPVAAHALR